MGHRRFVLRASSVVALLLSSTVPAFGSEADELFAEGKALMAEGRTEEACAKLAESERIEHGLGVRFQLAMCREQTGRTASAWAGYLAVASEAGARGQTMREKVAREYAARVERKLVRVRLQVKARSTPDLTVLRNGTVVEQPEWGLAIPVDPGTQIFEARAPQREPWKSVVEITPEKSTWTVEIPELEPKAEAASAAEAPKPATFHRPAAIVMAGAGVIAVGAATYLGLQAIDKNNASTPHCRNDQCDATGVGLRADALSHGTASTVGFAVGAALVTTAAILWILAPSRDQGRRGRIDVGALARLPLRGTW